MTSSTALHILLLYFEEAVEAFVWWSHAVGSLHLQ